MQPEFESNNNLIVNPFGDLKVALIHDFLIYPGGAEKVLEALSEIFPEAPIYTLLYDSEKMRGKFKNKKIICSYLQKFPKFLRQRHQWLLPFYPSAPETFDLREYDLIISSSGAWTKGVVTKLNTTHIAYIHSPMRFVWDYNERYIHERGKNKGGIIIRMILSYLRLWDKLAAERPDYLIANSQYTQERIKKYYRRESQVIYPPAIKNKNSVEPQKEGKYFLIVSRLSPYKKVDLVVEAFNKLELPLVVIGEGKQEAYLKKIAGANVKILGWQDEQKLDQYYREARAFIFPADDDFGITALEAMNFGIPVIAFNQGGMKEVVSPGETGEFFGSQTVEVLADSVRRFMEREKEYDRKKIQDHASDFSQELFKKQILDFLKEVLKTE